jgi:hypothetical protein
MTEADRALMYDIQPTPRVPEYVMMNNFPAPVLARGSIDLPVVCSRKGRVHVLKLRDVAYCPKSAWRILSWSKWADELRTSSGRSSLRLPEEGLWTGDREVAVPTTSGRVWGDELGGLFCLRLASAAREQANVIDVSPGLQEPVADGDTGEPDDVEVDAPPSGGVVKEEDAPPSGGAVKEDNGGLGDKMKLFEEGARFWRARGSWRLTRTMLASTLRLWG